jgi:hypothetical protein
MAINCTFDLLFEPWCYQNTRFTISHLKTIYTRLDIPDRIYIQQGHVHCSSEYAFIVMCVKLATEMTTIKLATEFGEFNHQHVSEMYRMMISMIDSKAEGILHGPNTMECWVASFPDFANRIERKLAQEEYGGLLFDNFHIFGFVDFKIVETCHPGSGPAEDQPGAPRHEDADLIQECVYMGYVKKHGLKILTVAPPNGLIGGLYGPVIAQENDIGTLNLSNLNQELMLLQPDVMEARENGEDMLYYSLYGDSIFPLLNCIVSWHR